MNKTVGKALVLCLGIIGGFVGKDYAVDMYHQVEFYNLGILYGTKYQYAHQPIVSDLEKQKEDMVEVFHVLDLPEGEEKELRPKFDYFIREDRAQQKVLVLSFIRGFRSVK